MKDAERLVSRDEIEAAVKGHNADYVEVRIDDASTNRLVYRGKELEEIGRTRSFGGCVRALVNGGWGFVSFNEPSGLQKRAEDAVSQARHVGKRHNHARDYSD
jgi:TldD protein